MSHSGLTRPGRARAQPGRGSLQPPAASRCSARSSLRAPSRGDPPRTRCRAFRCEMTLGPTRPTWRRKLPGRVSRPPWGRSSPTSWVCRSTACLSCAETPLGYRMAWASCDSRPRRFARKRWLEPPCGCFGASERSEQCAVVSALAIVNLGVKVGVQDVHRQVHQHEARRDEQHSRLNHRVVALGDPIQDKRAESR